MLHTEHRLSHWTCTFRVYSRYHSFCHRPPSSTSLMDMVCIPGSSDYKSNAKPMSSGLEAGSPDSVQLATSEYL